MANNLANRASANLAALRALRDSADKSMFPIGCRAGYNYNRNITTDALPAYLSRSRHVLPYGASQIAPVYVGGHGALAEQESAGFSGVHVGLAPAWGAAAGNAYDVNAIRRVTRQGKFNMTIPAGEFSVCDPIGVDIAAGTAIGLQFYAVGSTTNPLAGSRETARSKTWGEEFARLYASTSDLSLVQSGWPANDSNARACIVPAVILGRTADGIRRSSVAIIGHSIAYGQVSGGGLLSRDTGDNDGNIGWIERWIASQRPFSAFTIPGDELRTWMGVNNANALAANYAAQRFALLSLGFTDAIVQLEVNDFGTITVDQYEVLFRAFVNKLKGIGIRVHAVTPFPIADSTSTLAVQTKHAKSDMIVDWAARVRTSAVATWGCASVIDANAVLRDPVDTWKWRSDLDTLVGGASTVDFTHPSQLTTVWLAANLGVSATSLIPEFPS
ncbi:hypothetical protein VW35_00840 [Devosia soli]|uniref:Uncharacterized protein n=1 Tax=Devosia soli TaxID=361041 RepID=A0A0F5LGT7_9HYPH|nr:hypothetical protein [Devosia soli]KKB80787.1 hypothetical protein VW35_00840 [Devosia soli]